MLDFKISLSSVARETRLIHIIEPGSTRVNFHSEATG